MVRQTERDKEQEGNGGLERNKRAYER